jgi:copper chaperone CopZ
MSEKREMKQINMETLEKAESKVSAGNLKKAVITLAVLLALSGGGYGAYRLVAGDVVASRYAVLAMYCPACATTVQEVTAKIPGVIGTDVSLASQSVTVKYRSKRTNAEQIKAAIARKGYPTRIDGKFKPDGEGIDEAVVAIVNGKPLLEHDFKLASADGADKDPASGFYSAVGKEILLQAADSRTVVVQPSEIDDVIEAARKKQGLSKEDLVKKVTKNYGSLEKYRQMIAQQLSIRTLLDDYVLEDVKDPAEKQRKTLEWVGSLFKVADVKIPDEALRKKLQASAGKADWKTFWPMMISRKTELKKVLMP